MCVSVCQRENLCFLIACPQLIWKLMEYYWITSQQNRQTRIFSVLEESISGAFPTRMLRSRPSAEVPSTPDAEVPADMAGTCRPRLLVMPSHYFEEKPQDDLPVMTSKLGYGWMSKCVTALNGEGEDGTPSFWSNATTSHNCFREGS